MIPEKLEKATLTEISWNANQEPEEIADAHKVKVQFNPESLKLALANQNASGDQRGGSAIQYVGKGTSKLSFDLWFDATGSADLDVRDATNEVIYFMTPKVTDEEDKFIPPGVRFLWGSFLFEGVMDSLNEDLEYFSEDGRPLRAKLAIAMSRQEINYERGRQQGGSGLGSHNADQGKRQTRDGDTVPSLAGENWPAVALANGIETPLNLNAGTILDLRSRSDTSSTQSINSRFAIDASLEVNNPFNRLGDQGQANNVDNGLVPRSPAVRAQAFANNLFDQKLRR